MDEQSLNQNQDWFFRKSSLKNNKPVCCEKNMTNPEELSIEEIADLECSKKQIKDTSIQVLDRPSHNRNFFFFPPLRRAWDES